MFLQIFSSVFLTHLIMTQYYPEKYRMVLLLLTEKLIFAYSFVELKANKLYKQIKNNSSVNSLIEQMKSPNNVEVILNNQLVNHLNKESIYLNLPFDNDFIIYSEPEPMTSRTNKLIIHNYSKSIREDDFKYKLCDYMFISTTLYLETRSLVVNYDLKLFCNGNNYFVCGNEIDKYVICYLLKQQKNVNFSPESCKYKLSIIDQNANIVEFNETDVLCLYKENYQVFRSEKYNSDNENEENENSGSSVGSKEYEIVENDNN